MANRLQHISQLLETNLQNATNFYSQIPPSPRSPPSPLIHLATLDQVNFHSGGHFARECRAPRNQGNKNGDAGYKSMENTRKTVPMETSDALVVQDNALIVQDGLGYDWSYIAQDDRN
ncbi:hypothetical protein Tco_1172310 [Tanacetum coccineum]